jgi:hypothetical protein
MACLLMTSVVAAGHPSSDAPRCCATFTALGCSASSSGCEAHSNVGIVSALKAKNFFTIVGFGRHPTDKVILAGLASARTVAEIHGCNTTPRGTLEH